MIYLQLKKSFLSVDVHVLYGILLEIRENSIERIAFPNEKTEESRDSASLVREVR